MQNHGILIYMAADNDLNPYGKLNDLIEIQESQINMQSWPLAVQFHSPKDDEANTDGILSIAFRNGKEIGRTSAKTGINTGDPKYLIDFIRWGLSILNCEKYSLIIWGHGTGPVDIEKKAELITKAVAFDYSDSDALTTAELWGALRDILGDKRFSVLGFDACLMASVEVSWELSPLCDVYVGSESETGPLGWPYRNIIIDLANSSSDSSAGIGKIICDDFIKMIADESPERPTCISSIAADKLVILADSMRALINELLLTIGDPLVFNDLFQARMAAFSVWDYGVIDIFSFADNLANESVYLKNPIKEAAKYVCRAIETCVLSNMTQNIKQAKGL